MTRPRPARRVIALALLTILAGRLGAPAAAADQAGAQDPAKAHQPGQFFPIVEPISDETIRSLRAAAVPYIERIASTGQRPVLVFEFRPGESEPGRSSFGASLDLAEFLLKDLSGAKRRVAFVPEPLTGYAVLAVLGCDEIVLGPNASLGPISPDGAPVNASKRESVRELANQRGRDAELLLGMLDPGADLREVRTDRGTHYVLAENLPEFKKTHRIIEDQPAWEGGRRGVLTADRARRTFVTRFAENRPEVAAAYNLANVNDDPLLGERPNPVRIRIDGAIGDNKEAYLLRKISEARHERVNLIFFEIDSEGGLQGPADKVAERIARLKDIKTIAFIEGQCVGVSSLIALACDEIAVTKSARLGKVTETVPERGGAHMELEPRMAGVLADRAEDLARRKGHPAAVARAMVDRDAVVLLARDKQAGAVTFVLESQVLADPGRYEVVEKLHSAGDVLLLEGEAARKFGMTDRIVKDFAELQAAYGLRGKTIRADGPTWVDSLVFTLNTPFVKGLLLFIGFFMLVLELKLPGIGLPAITSALAFLLYFWSSYLGGTADQLEILLFLVGIVCLGLELFVFPGFGVFGMSGVVLILVSVVMASHTFVWPSQEYEFRQMGQTLVQITVVLVAVIAGAIVFGRYFPSLPFFNRMILRAEPADNGLGDSMDKPSASDEPSYFFLLGETGRTTTVLKPTGKARFGDHLIDVSAERSFIEADRLVEVVEVRGSRVIVRQV
jgi:membrane-bound serine protease (ClpP class)